MTTTILTCPAWCTSAHTTVGDAGLHDSPTVTTTSDSGSPATARLIRLDPEPGHDEITHEAWVTVGDYQLEVQAENMPAFAAQLRELAAAIDMLHTLTGGAQ